MYVCTVCLEKCLCDQIQFVLVVVVVVDHEDDDAQHCCIVNVDGEYMDLFSLFA